MQRIRWAENVHEKGDGGRADDAAAKKSGGVFRRVREMLSGLTKGEKKKKQRRSRSLPPNRHFCDSTGRMSEEAYNFRKNFDNYVAPPPKSQRPPSMLEDEATFANTPAAFSTPQRPPAARRPAPVVTPTTRDSAFSFASSGFEDEKSLPSIHWMSSVMSDTKKADVKTPLETSRASDFFERPSRSRQRNDSNNNGARRRVAAARRVHLRCQSCGANFRDSQVMELVNASPSPSPVRSAHSFVREASARLESWQLEMAASAAENAARASRWYAPSFSSTSDFSLTLDESLELESRGRVRTPPPVVRAPDASFGSPVGFVRTSRTPVYASGFAAYRAPPPTRTPPEPPI
ncbi:hypothetical protein M3Y99_00129200 [Aphelenchoides fujianensis]|nr:hypothetical protein M3Y99_00129200 [Aphelenchoides fujianensis]